MWHCKHCHLTIQSNTVSSFCVQVNVCKRQWVSKVTKGPFKSETMKSNAHHILVPRVYRFVFTWSRGEILYSDCEHQYCWLCLMTEMYVKRALICSKLTLAACHKRYFSRSCQCEPPKANMSSKAMSWAEPRLWPLMGFQPIFTWQIQWSERVLKRQKVKILLLWKFCSHCSPPW